MWCRSWGFAVLGIAVVALSPSPGRTQSYNKDAVKALSERIDGHLAKVWQKAKVTPAVKADDYVYFRRLNLDLNGRIPDLLNLADFRDDQDPDKRWKWVDEFLEGKDHPRHFANVWRNIMLGYQTNQQVQFALPQFETWLRERVERNVPLNKTVEELLLNQQGGPNMGFNRGGMPNVSSPQVFFIANENKAENLAAATSRVFLGVKIECAQCHPHPFAKWSKDQFWEFAAFYSQIQPTRRPNPAQPLPPMNFQVGREIQIPGTDKVVKARFLNGESPKWGEGFNNPRKVLSDWITSEKNPYFARAMADHLWTYLMGVSLLEPIMEPSDDTLMTHPELLDDLAKGLIDNGFDAKFLIRAIVHSNAYQRSSAGSKLADKEDYELFTRMPMRPLSPEQLYDSFVHATTSPTSKRRADLLQMPNPQQFFNPNAQQTFRQQFLFKFTNQDRRHEPQTSILQALFLMNGRFMAEQTRLDGPNSDNEDLALLANSTNNAATVGSLYKMVLSRPPTAQEEARLVRFLEQGGGTGSRREAVTDIFWALLNSSEFLLNH